MYLRDKFALHLKYNIVYKWSCPEENYIQFYISESSRCSENRAKEHSSHATSAVHVHFGSNNHPQADISLFRVIDQDSKKIEEDCERCQGGHPHQDQKPSTQ